MMQHLNKAVTLLSSLCSHILQKILRYTFFRYLRLSKTSTRFSFLCLIVLPIDLLFLLPKVPSSRFIDWIRNKSWS